MRVGLLVFPDVEKMCYLLVGLLGFVAVKNIYLPTFRSCEKMCSLLLIGLIVFVVVKKNLSFTCRPSSL